MLYLRADSDGLLTFITDTFTLEMLMTFSLSAAADATP